MKSALPLRRYNYEPVVVRHRRRLPHWITPFGIYFLTIHILDAIPHELLQRWREDLNDALREARTQADTHELQRDYISKIERALDRGYGAHHLANRNVASALRDTFLHDDRSNYDLLAWCVMPTHAHVVFRLLGGPPLDEVVKAWKRVSALAAQRELGLKGSLWQEDYFDVLVRDNHHLLRAIEYTLDNPVKAGLNEWPWFGVDQSRIDQLL